MRLRHLLVAGHVIAAITFILVQAGIIQIHFLYVASVLFIVSCFIFIMASVSLGQVPSAENINDLTFSSGYAEPESDTLAWYANFRVQAAVVVALTVMMLITFW